MLILPLTSFSECHAIRDCLSLTEFIILSIWPWMYTYSSFWYELFSSNWTFLSFYICWVSVIRSEWYFEVISLFLTTSDSHGSPHLVVGLLDMQSTAPSMGPVMNFSHSSFNVCLPSIDSVTYSHRILISHVSIGKWSLSVTRDYDCFLFLRRFKCISAVAILWLENTPSKKNMSLILETYFPTFCLWVYNRMELLALVR